ncbi:MAG: PAS domain S-box protein [Granulosicoccaceae bacterium]
MPNTSSNESSNVVARLSDISVVLDSVDAAVITIDSLGNILEVNPATERLFGYPKDEMLGNNVKMLMPAPYRDQHDGFMADHLRTGESNIIGVGRQVYGLRADKLMFPIHLAVGKHTLDDETLFTGIIHDLSYQTAQTEDSTRLGQILDESLNEIFVFDASTYQFTMVSRGAMRNLGYSRKEIMSTTPIDIIPDHSVESFEALIKPLLDNTQQRITFSTRHQRKDGSFYDVDVTLSLSKSNINAAEFVAIIDDVTEKNKLLKMMHQSQKLESVGQLTGGIAHDFNNLLTVISGNLELLEAVVSTPLHQDILKDARDASNMGARLTNRLLAFASRSSLTPQTININTLVLDMIELLRRTIGENISLKTNLASELWTTKVDVSQLENSLLNLTINARDAMPEGGRLTVSTNNVTTDDLEYTSSNTLLGDFVKVTVSDTGHGIESDNINEIFEPFYTTKTEKLGTGLGLSMVYGFVRQTGGFVDVTSDADRGSAFTLYIPREHSNCTQNSQNQESKYLVSKKSKTILLVEDEDGVRKLTRRRLEKLGHSVIEARNGYEALERFKRTEGIDIVFTDMVMTAGMTGYDLAKLIYGIEPKISVLITSGYASELLDPKKLDKLGISLLRKPYSIKDLEHQLALI